ncbi:MAG: class I SAM-dependent methyltransferase [Cohaesibacteraceae bacterium]
MTSFQENRSVARYGDQTKRLVPGLDDMHRMAGLLLAETLDEAAHILVLGAGGGQELKAFADNSPSWRFLGVDPSTEMLELAKQVASAHLGRIAFQEGTIEDAPAGPFDGATCLLTLHFLAPEDRLRTLIALRQRMRPGAPLIIAHHSFPQQEDDKARWLGRFAAFAVSSGLSEDQAQRAVRSIGSTLPILSPQDDEDLLREAGFDDVQLFYAAFTFRGWVAYAR